ncbi:MAG: hypothetical protein HC884_18885 [Chloroflexaceae bacterium]|nr:hypothetical protein [Chloroflexaceae bacterium]
MEGKTSRDRTKRQIIGKRLGLEPYYVIAENTDTRLRIHSRPDANVKTGRLFMGVGAVLVLFSMALFCVGLSSYVEGMRSIGPFALSALVSAPCGIVGFLGLLGGMAIGRTVNTITINMETRTVAYTQQSKTPIHSKQAKNERKQILDFADITALRYTSLSYKPAFFLSRPHQIVVLEFLTRDGTTWTIDSAVSVASLEPLATAFSSVLGVEVQPIETDNGSGTGE